MVNADFLLKLFDAKIGRSFIQKVKIDEMLFTIWIKKMPRRSKSLKGMYAFC
jgi:hypothetical protein